MSQQIMFFEKSKIDQNNENVVYTVTDATASDTGESIAHYVGNRNNYTYWMTTDSNDAANTQLDIDMVDEYDFTDIFLVLHNFKAFTIQYWDGSAYQDFSTAINETTNSDNVTRFTFNQVTSSKLRIIITGTQVADEDKQIAQIIVTSFFNQGQLNYWPVVKSPISSLNKREVSLLSGKTLQIETIGSFSCTLDVESWLDSDDLGLVEALYFRRQGVLMYLSGGDETQFWRAQIGFREEDFYLVKPANEFNAQYRRGIYKLGNVTSIELKESAE